MYMSAIWEVTKPSHSFYLVMYLQCYLPRMDKQDILQSICDVMGQNQSHVTKHEMAEICIFSENVKIYPFFVFTKNKIFV